MNEPKFLICEHCSNLIEMICDKNAPIMCCGQKMTELEAGTVEASREKHIPVVNVNANTVEVCVGSVEHPATQEHLINWIYLLTDCGCYRKTLTHTDKPYATFALSKSEKPVAAYAYCNLHGLWKAEI